MDLDLLEAMKMAFVAGITWERDHFALRGEPSPDDDLHESTLVSFCIPGQPLKNEIRRNVLESLKNAFRHGQACEREMRAKLRF
jgi:hypothetical protein